MKRILLITFCCVAAFVAAAKFRTHAQDDNPQLTGYTTVRPLTGVSSDDAQVGLITPSTIPMFTYSITATKDSSVRTGTMVGRSPFARGKTTTSINVVIVPVIITIGSTTFDSTAVETCGNGAGKGLTTTQLLEQSPMFVNSPWTLNGVNVGTTQHGDAFRRAEFWSLVQNTPYHTLLSYTEASPVTISSATVGTHGIINGSGCGTLGIVSNAWFSGLLENTIIPGIPSASTTTFVLFALRNVVQADNDPPTIVSPHCCILGYHGSYLRSGVIQTYSPTEYDTSARFGGVAFDSSVLTHEVLEWYDDPLGNNPTPAWGSIGQVPVGSCQGNLEVGDPLTGTNLPLVVMPNTVTYKVQELAFFSWFFNSVATPSLGTGGKFSSGGTFSGPSKACLPGGTN